MRPSLLTWLGTSLSARVCLGGAFLLSCHSRASSASGTRSFSQARLSLELFNKKLFRLQASAGSRSAFTITWRLRFCLLEVGHSTAPGPCCGSSSGSSVLLMARVLQLHNSVLCNLDLFLKLSDITSKRSFQDDLISSGMFLM